MLSFIGAAWESITWGFGKFWTWWETRPNKGGSDFVEFCIGINIVQIGWKEFQNKVRYADRRCAKMVDETVMGMRDESSRRWVRVIIEFITSPFRSGFLWRVNYFFTVLSVVAGACMLYLNSFCPHDYLLLMPAFLYVALTYSGLIVTWVALLCCGFLAKKVDSVRAAEQFTQSEPAINPQPPQPQQQPLQLTAPTAAQPKAESVPEQAVFPAPTPPLLTSEGDSVPNVQLEPTKTPKKNNNARKGKRGASSVQQPPPPPSQR